MRHRTTTSSKPGRAGTAAPQAAQTIQQALALHREGQLDAAGQLYARALAANPANFDALHLMGVLRHQQQQSVDALRLVEAALRLQPGSADALTNYGVILDALKRHQEALAAYEKVLAARPADVTAHFNKGLALKKLGRHAEALAAFERTLALAPRHGDALYHRGSVLLALGRLDDACASLEAALACRPGHIDARNGLGLALAGLGRPEAALTQFDTVLTTDPDHYGALLNRANTLIALEHFDEALTASGKVLAIAPSQPAAHNTRGVALGKLRRYEDALASYDHAIALRAEFAEAHANRGTALHKLGRHEEALESYDRALALQPDHAEAHSNRGNTLRDMNRCEEALESHDRALALRPDLAEAHCNRGNALLELRRFGEALDSYDRSIALRPNYAEAHCNRGNVLAELRRFDEALSSFGHAQMLRPGLAEAHSSEALCRLLTGDFKHGWQQHEWRWETEQLKRVKRQFAQPQWTGSDDIAGKTVLLHAEQGFGDTLQFCRYAPLVAARGAAVILDVQQPLATLLRSLPGGIHVVSRGEPLPDFDLHCPLLSLPLAFDTALATIPSRTPYLVAPDRKVAAWRDRLGERRGPRIGLVWAGDPRKSLPHANRIDRQRSLAFDALAPILRVPDCTFYSLQKGGDAQAQLQGSAFARNVIDCSDGFHDFSDTAALIENLDLVIAVDTAVAHLAGALGKPLWLLNRYNTCWRWLLERDDSPWYPTARIFRQDETRTWDGVIARVQAALSDYVGDFAG